MGYYTYHNLEVMTADNAANHPNRSEIIAQLRKENENAEWAIDEEGTTNSEMKWYDSCAEMREFSKKFQDAVFVLHGDGEGSDDFWCAYFRNGKAQIASGRIEYDEFDESKLE